LPGDTPADAVGAADAKQQPDVIREQQPVGGAGRRAGIGVAQDEPGVHRAAALPAFAGPEREGQADGEQRLTGVFGPGQERCDRGPGPKQARDDQAAEQPPFAR
jgi:hypothetical protein